MTGEAEPAGARLGNLVEANESSAELGEILAGVVRDVLEAQDALDEHAQQAKARALATPEGTIVIPPLWYTFSDVTVEVELAARLERQNGRGRFACRTCSRAITSLHGRAAATDIRVRLQLTPQGILATQRGAADRSA